MQGPLPVVVDGEVIGAIGASELHDPKEDEQVAKAGLADLGQGAKAKRRLGSRRFTDLYLISLGSGHCSI
jgi:hypothetical protein